MLKKLFKYEWKASARVMLVLYGIVILFTLLSRLLMEVSGIRSGDGSLPIVETISALILMISVVLIGSSVIFTWIFIAYRFYKSVFTEQGYLTNTLPVTQQQIIIAKGLTGVIWQVINWLVVVAAFLIMAADGNDFVGFFKIFPEIFRMFTIRDIALSVWLILFIIIASPFTMVLEMYMCIAVGNLLSGHKVLGAVGTYAGLYVVQCIIGVIVMVCSGLQYLSVEYTGNTVEMQSRLQHQLLSTLNINLAAALIVSLAFIAMGYLVTKHIMTKRLNLQ
ncbi:MAG: hypothetical protein ACOX8E_12040 [Ruminococcus sp.]|jgi:hypothetical protein